MSTTARLGLLLAIAALAPAADERINQEGRILGAQPAVAGPILFNTAAADAVVAAMQIMPLTSAWNEDISRRPRLANSDAMIAQITADLASTRRTLRMFHEMNYVLVPDAQPLVPISFLVYPDDSDPGPYPIPATMPIETWPRGTGTLSLQDWQRDVGNVGGDRHSIVVMPGTGGLWETWQARYQVGGNPPWRASNGAYFDIDTNDLRPAGWTSGDAAGLPMFPALVRYDECQRGMVEHAMRIVVKRTRREYLYPATHHASTIATDDPVVRANVPAMGQRVRLKASWSDSSKTWSIAERAVIAGLKKYGALVADNGGFFSISVCPDDRFAEDEFADLASIPISAFEVVQATGAAEGPRAPNAPRAVAGPDQAVSRAAGATLAGASVPAGVPLRWYVYPHAPAPGAVTFADAQSGTTGVTFGAAGTYTLMLSVDDGSHAVAHDAVLVTVSDGAPNQPPTVATAASATPSPVTGTSAALAALGADDGGEAALRYTWSTTGSPPAAVGFSPNASHAARASTATFTRGGTYGLLVTITDAGGLSATSALSVTVAQTPSAITVSPASASVATGAGRQFTASQRDQFGSAILPGPAFAWSVAGGGTIDPASGLFTAGATAGGPHALSAGDGVRSGSAQVTVAAAKQTGGGGKGCGLGSGLGLLLLALAMAWRGAR